MDARTLRGAGLAVALALVPASAAAAPGDLDPTFGEAGVVQPVVGVQNSQLTRLAVDSQGRLVGSGVAYARTEAQGPPYARQRIAVGRFSADGILDETFATGGLFVQPQTTDDVRMTATGGLAIGSDDAIHVAGNWSPDANGGLTARLTPGGAFDPLYDGDGIETAGAQPVDLLIQPDGKLLVATRQRVYEAPDAQKLRRVTTSGATDLTFGGGDGEADMPTTASVVGQRAGGGLLVVVPTTVDLGDGQTAVDLAFSGLTADGTADPSFTPVTTRVPGLTTVTGFTWADDGSVVVLGLHGCCDERVARLLPGLALDTDFGTGGVAAPLPPPLVSFSLYRAAVDASGRILLAGGSETEGGTDTQITVIRLLKHGAVDPAFGTNGARRIVFPGPGAPTTFGPFSSATRLLIQPNGRIVLGGWGSMGSSVTWLLVGLQGGEGTAPPAEEPKEEEPEVKEPDTEGPGKEQPKDEGEKGSGDGRRDLATVVVSDPQSIPPGPVPPPLPIADVRAAPTKPAVRLLGPKGRGLRVAITWPPAWRDRTQLRVRTTGRRPVVVASRGLAPRAGQSVTVTVPLTARGRRLLARSPRTRLVVSLTMTLTG